MVLNNESVIIARNDLSNSVTIDLQKDIPEHINLILRGKNNPELFIQCNNYSFIYSYEKNQLYVLQYPIWGGIYLIVSLFILILSYLQQYRAKQRYETEKKIAELQLKSVRNQTDSHFNLNILNSIGSLFNKQETEKANYIFGKYAKLLRSSVISSDQIFLSMDKELEDVENYLVLEKFRLSDVFDYLIQVEEGVNTDLQIPKMLIHTFVENAIKHGLRHLKSGGKLEINISRNANQYIIHVKDNGIGRAKAKEHASLSTGRGMKILDQILDLYFSLTKTKITYKIEDLYQDDDSPAGTEAIILIHLK